MDKVKRFRTYVGEIYSTRRSIKKERIAREEAEMGSLDLKYPFPVFAVGDIHCEIILSLADTFLRGNDIAVWDVELEMPKNAFPESKVWEKFIDFCKTVHRDSSDARVRYLRCVAKVFFQSINDMWEAYCDAGPLFDPKDDVPERTKFLIPSQPEGL
jgi:hypothetical protein